MSGQKVVKVKTHHFSCLQTGYIVTGQKLDNFLTHQSPMFVQGHPSILRICILQRLQIGQKLDVLRLSIKNFLH